MILKERADAKASAEREAAMKSKEANTKADAKNAVEMSGSDKPNSPTGEVSASVTIGADSPSPQ